jgi:steroid delta-isomerase-like uncharacterized protein
MSADPKELWQRYINEVWNQGHMEMIDELIHEDFIDHTPTGDQEHGRNGIKWFVNMIRTAFPDVQGRIEHIISQGDMVAVHLVFEGTHTGGELFGIPATGKRIALKGLDILKVEDGKLAHSWANFDQAGMMAQLGVIPQAGPGAVAAGGGGQGAGAPSGAGA